MGAPQSPGFRVGCAKGLGQAGLTPDRAPQGGRPAHPLCGSPQAAVGGKPWDPASDKSWEGYRGPSLGQGIFQTPGERTDYFEQNPGLTARRESQYTPGTRYLY